MKFRSPFTRSCLALAYACAVLVANSSALASSHREAPMITADSRLDNTDLYSICSSESLRDGYGRNKAVPPANSGVPSQANRTQVAVQQHTRLDAKLSDTRLNRGHLQEGVACP